MHSLTGDTLQTSILTDIGSRTDRHTHVCTCTQVAGTHRQSDSETESYAQGIKTPTDRQTDRQTGSHTDLHPQWERHA